MPFSLIPRETKFFPLYTESANQAVAAGRLLKELVDNCTDVAEKAAKITEVEQANGRLTHDIIAQIHKTFVTPFDREDMAELANSLHDVIDFVEASAVAMHLYRAECPVGKARDLADSIVRCCEKVRDAVSLLGNKKEYQKILDDCKQIHELESEADGIFRSARAELFDNTLDMAFVIKWHEIYQLMEDATDRCEDVSDVLEEVVLKNA
jgi:predicted phosphate transport protein (TIGR00153 family)